MFYVSLVMVNGCMCLGEAGRSIVSDNRFKMVLFNRAGFFDAG